MSPARAAGSGVCEKPRATPAWPRAPGPRAAGRPATAASAATARSAAARWLPCRGCAARHAAGLPRRGSMRFPVGHEHVAEAPDGLDVRRLRGILLDQFPQARHLDVDRAVEDLVLAAARE